MLPIIAIFLLSVTTSLAAPTDVFVQQQQPLTLDQQPLVAPPAFVYQQQQQQQFGHSVEQNTVNSGLTVPDVSTGTVETDEKSAKAQILQQETELNADGSFYNVWNSDNGITVQEQGAIKKIGEAEVAVSSGQISYVDAEGHQYYLKYTADENGFRVQGDHLPTPPPVPLAIARGLEFIAAHPYVETTITPVLNDQFQQNVSPVVVDN